MSQVEQSKLKSIKYMIWLYFILLVFEGGLRKWVLPGLATPLLIIRDPIAIFLIFKATQLRIQWFNNYIKVAWIVTAFSFVLTLLIGHQNIMVAIFGSRIMFIHFPLIFIIGQVFNKKDVIQIGKVLLLISLFMTPLIALQYFSPQSAWVNRAVGGGEEGSGFSGANGYFRPSGVFSFTNGVVMFYQICLPYILFFWISGYKIRKLLLYASSIAFLLALVLCLSRTLIASSVITLLFLAIYSFNSPSHSFKVLKIIGILTIIVVLLQFTTIFNLATDTLIKRFELASNSEGDFVQGSIVNRVFGGFTEPISHAFKSPFFEGKLGMGTNVGASLLTGSHSYLISEGEIGRVLGERGLIFGFIILILRFFLMVSIGIKSFYLLKKDELLSWLLFSASGINILIGLWGQPTALGFVVIPVGLCLAYFRTNNLKTS